MKKILLAIIGLVLFASASFAQHTVPRFSINPASGDNTGAALNYGWKTPVYAASIALAPNFYETTVKPGTLTGALTLTAVVTNCWAADRMNLVLTADGTDRIVTFSTGFSSENDTVSASSTAFLQFIFNGVAWIRLSGQDLTTGLAGDGTVGAPGISFVSDPDNGLYRVGANHYAASVGGSKVVDFATTGVAVTGTFSATSFTAPVIKRTATAINTTATVTAAQLAGGLLTSTSAATVTMTLPTATAMATQIGAVQGTTFDFVVDNSAGSNTVTVAVGSGIVASGFPGTNTLTLASSATVGTALFRLTFISATAATLARIN